MKANIGSIDRAVRFIIGLILIGLSAFGVIGWWGWLGAVLVVTAVIRFCPLYRLIGIRTCKVRY